MAAAASLEILSAQIAVAIGPNYIAVMINAEYFHGPRRRSRSSSVT